MFVRNDAPNRYAKCLMQRYVVEKMVATLWFGRGVRTSGNQTFGCSEHALHTIPASAGRHRFRNYV